MSNNKPKCECGSDLSHSVEVWHEINNNWTIKAKPFKTQQSSLSTQDKYKSIFDGITDEEFENMLK